MKSNLYTKFAVLVLGLSVSAASTYADVNVNARQLSNGQSIEIFGTTPSTINSIENGAKTENTVRIGLATVKTGAIGEGINPQELAGAIQNTLSEYLKGSRVELVPIEAKLAAAIETEAKEKQCAYVLYAIVSHKKGGGGFGMFKAIAPVMSSVIPMAGGMGGAIAGSVASTAINTAASATSNVKKKDELTLDIKVNSTGGGAAALARQFKAKAQSEGEDIISPMIEQAAQAIIDAVAK